MDHCSRVRPPIPFLLLFVLLFGSAQLYGGTGRTRTVGAVTVFDFCVSIRFSATATQIDNIERAIEDGNEILMDATDGRARFGDVHIVNNSGASREAELWILPDSGRAFATFGEYGVAGTHITMFYPSNFTGDPDIDGDAYTVAHEFVHHIWNIRDEYSGPSGAGDCEAPPGSSTASFCLMDNYFTRGGRIGIGTTYTLNELCISSNHDPDDDTFQDNQWNESCWETIADHATRALTAPGGLPTDAAPAITAPTFRLPIVDRRFVVCIDRSGSMGTADAGDGTPTRLDYAKQAAGIFIDLANPGDKIGITSFSDNSSADLALTEIIDDDTKETIKGVVNDLDADGNTAIGSGLIESRDLFTAETDLSCVQTVILFTDGHGNSGPDETSVIPSLIENDITVIAVAVGTDVSTSNLQQIATQTAGKFFLVGDASDLPALLAALTAEATGGGVLAQQPESVDEDETVEFEILVDGGPAEVTFGITWPDPNDVIDLELEAPDGTTITPSDASDADIDYIAGSGARFYDVRGSALQTGTWTMHVTGTTIAGAGVFDLIVMSAKDDESFVLTSELPEYDYDDPVLLRGTPQHLGINVVGATVSGTFVRADGTPGTIQLFDDGSSTHGDQNANDGVYSALFTSFGGSGAYQFDLVATADDDSTFEGESLFASVSHPAIVYDAPDFVRLASHSVVVNDVPPNVPPVAVCRNVVVSADENCEAMASIDYGSYDPNPYDEITLVQTPAGPYQLGETVVTLTVTDRLGESDECEAIVTVVDDTPPEISVSVTPTSLWPPNHHLAAIEASVVVTDNCPDATFTLTSITSSEADNGLGDGDAPNDIQDASIGTADLAFTLRAERSGTGSGRTYTVTYTAEDGSGNTTSASTTVTVPATMGRRVSLPELGSNAEATHLIATADRDGSRLKFQVGMAKSGRARLEIFDQLGRSLGDLFDDRLDAGYHGIEVDATLMPPGIYIVTLTTIADDGERSVDSKKVVWVR